MEDKNRKKRPLLIAIVGALFILCIAFFCYRTAKEAIVENEQNSMMNLASVGAQNLKLCLQAKVNLVKGAFSGDMGEEERIRQGLLKIGEKGRYLSLTEGENLEPEERQMCEKAGKSPGEVIVGRVTKSERYILYLTKAVYLSGSIVGYIQVEVDLDDVYREEQILSGMELLNQGYCIIKDGAGNTIVPRSDKVGDSEIEMSTVQAADRGCMLAWIYEVREGTPERTRKLIAYETIEFQKEQFTLYMIENYDTVVQPIERISLYLCILAAALFGWLGFFLYRLVAKQKEEERLILELQYEKEINEALKNQEGLMEKYNHQKTTAVLTGAIAHEFNNLMTPIVLYADILGENEVVKEEMPQEVEELRSSAMRCEELARQLLDYNRQGRTKKVLTDYNATFAVESSINILKKILPQNIKLEVNICKSSYYIRGQIGAVNQILLNMASNAMQAMEAGGVLSIHFGRSIKELEMVRLMVRDSGVGMEAEVRYHIFEPFYTTKAKTGGTGIGLTVVRRLVEEHGGRIQVMSETGMGTTFLFDFPIIKK